MTENDKPCLKLGYCPYGYLVELFPLHGIQTERFKPKRNAKPCEIYGHDCPRYYVAENLTKRDREVLEPKKE